MNPVAEILAAGPIVLAPMAGVTEAPFRGICKRMGAGLTYTEMVSAKGLHYNPDSTISRRLLTFDADEVPCAVQIFGAEPELMAEQTRSILSQVGADVALIDINMGCPVTKVIAKGEGSALMRTPELAAEIVTAVVEAAEGTPVTAKFRSGWDADERNAVEFAQLVEAAGASAVAVHGRTRAQFYHGVADWESIAEVKRSVGIPVLGSGDVFTAEDALAMIEQTGVDGVMVARGAQGNPWLFAEARALLAGEPKPAPPGALERLAIAREHFVKHLDATGERGFPRMRKHLAWYVHGLPGATFMREKVMRAATSDDLLALLDEYRDYIASRRAIPAEELPPTTSPAAPKEQRHPRPLRAEASEASPSVHSAAETEASE